MDLRIVDENGDPYDFDWVATYITTPNQSSTPGMCKVVVMEGLRVREATAKEIASGTYMEIVEH